MRRRCPEGDERQLAETEMPEMSFYQVKMAEVMKLTDQLANSIMIDRILGRDVSKERISTLMRVAIVLHENEIAWPSLLREVLSWQVDLADVQQEHSNPHANQVHGLDRAKLPPSNNRQHGELRGSIDACTQEFVCGWAQDLSCPTSPVLLEVICGDKVLGTVSAEVYRDDLRASGIGSGNHAFAFEFGGTMQLSNEPIEIRRAADKALLGARPRV